ncbi:MAG: hypothetical protein AAGI51_12945 [Pseudomonadota bacterium]
MLEDGVDPAEAEIELDRFDGVELDLREGEDGEARIEHAPVFRIRARSRRVPRRFSEAMAMLARKAPHLRAALLDVKTARAAEQAGAALAAAPTPFQPIFNCWHADDIHALRRRLPDAKVMFVTAPIFARRAPRGRLRDLYLSNSYPFVRSRRLFLPKAEKSNGHAINVKLISKRRLRAFVPPTADGLCVHRLFCTPPLVEFAKERGLELAVYGLDDEDLDPDGRVARAADYAILKDSRRRLRLARRRTG